MIYCASATNAWRRFGTWLPALWPGIRVHSHHSANPGANTSRVRRKNWAQRCKFASLGRIQTMRRMGKAGFAHLQQDGARLQIYIKKDAVPERDYKLFHCWTSATSSACEGFLFRTKTGELSVHVEKLYFLSKILLAHAGEVAWPGGRRDPLPAALSRPDRQPGRAEVFVTRAKIIASLRRQLEDRGFIEVETPMMQPLLRRRGSTAVCHSSQYARHRPVPPHRSGTLFEASGGRRNGASVRDQSQFSK